MGCDIHAFIEYKRFDEWHLWAKLELDRDYSLFADMACVRGQGMFRPKGLPDDVGSWMQEEDIDHTPSWLTMQEFEKVLWYAESPTYEAALAAMRVINRTFQTRLVFWFDS